MRYNNEYSSIEPCPADKINLSLLIQLGFAGSNLIKFLNKIVATSAIPIGIPGCPELALCTASTDKNLIEFAKSLLSIFKNYPV